MHLLSRSIIPAGSSGFAVAVVAPMMVVLLFSLIPDSPPDGHLFAALFAAVVAGAFLGGWIAGVTAVAVCVSAYAYLRFDPSSMFSFALIGALGTLPIALLQRRLASETAGARRVDPSNGEDERFSIVFNSAPVAIMLVRLDDGRIVDVNAAFTELWQYTYSEALGRTSNELLLWIEPAQLIQKLKANRHSDVQELQIRRKSDESRDVLASVKMIHVDGSAHLLITAADVSERNRAAQMEHIAHHDTLTQLPNRLLLWSRLNDLRERTTATGVVSAVLFVDLDRFKYVNDTFGHRAGDELLRFVAARLQGRLRPSDLLARIGGDEFVVVLENLSRRAEAEVIANELVQQIAMPFVLSGGEELQIGASVGVSYFDDADKDVDKLVRQADRALYDAKLSGRNAVRVFDPMNALGRTC